MVLYLLKDSKPEIRFRKPSDATWSEERGFIIRLGWDTSTRAVGGTPAKPSWSRTYARTSRRDDSPDLTPGRKHSLPNGALKERGLLGAKGSSSIGFQTAIGIYYSSSPMLLKIYEPLVPSSVRHGYSPSSKPLLIDSIAILISKGTLKLPKLQML